MIHLHLDALGGLAGDMFAAGMLDAFPDLLAVVEANVARAVPTGMRCRLAPHDDGVLAGHRFLVEDEEGRAADAAAGRPVGTPGHDHGHGPARAHDHHHDHPHEAEHSTWGEIREGLRGSGIAPPVLRHALGIFGVLAGAEARVHGTVPDRVRFHEVGAADSIADVVAAATLIDAVGAGSWSVSALPIGGGRLRSAHGPMPVPAPATTILLEGFAVLDDGVAGERVTPTGAAILRWLREDGMLRDRRPAGRIGGSGIGFGTRRLPGLSNCVRVLWLEGDPAVEQPAADGPAHRELAVISFEVDDQSPEELAAGLDRVRALSGVHDVVQMPCFGKKNRMGTHVQVLARPDAMAAAVAACFGETTTIGLRTHVVRGQALPRRVAEVAVDGAAVAVKLVRRPGGGDTAKAEADHVASGAAGTGGQAARAALRRRAEAEALATVSAGSGERGA